MAGSVESFDVAYAKLHAPVTFSKFGAILSIFDQASSYDKNAKEMAKHFGKITQYNANYLKQHHDSAQYYAVVNQIIVQLVQIVDHIMHEPEDAGTLLSTFQQYPSKSKHAVINAIFRWLITNDAMFAKTHQPVIKKTSPVKQPTKPVQNTVPVKKQKPSVPKKLKVPSVNSAVNQQQEHLASNQVKDLSQAAKAYLDLTPGKAHLDNSFRDHPVVLGWKDNWQADRSVSKSTFTTSLGSARGYTLDDQQVGFLARLRRQFSQLDVLTPHALELAFGSSKGLRRVPRGVQVEAMALIGEFAVEDDYVGLAAVLHGRYATEYAVRRKQGWESLSVANVKGGLVDQLLTGDFDHTIKSIFIETAFWYYLARWAYLRSETASAKDRAYLKPDETNFSPEAQRIIAEIREHDASNGDFKTAGELAKLKNQLRQMDLSMRDVRALTGVMLASSIFQYNLETSDEKQIIDKDGKLTLGTQAEIKKYLTQNGTISQYIRLIQQSVPELSKRISEYQQGERRNY